MPRASPINGPSLTINLSGSASTYTPGDTLSGYVSRQSHIVDPNATITILLRGRAKSLIRSNSDGSGPVFRGRFNFWGDGIGFQIFQGPLHIEKQSTEWHTWPFTIKIPATASPDVAVGNDGAWSYLMLQKVDLNPLPATYSFTDDKNLLGYSEGFVEYTLLATLHGSHGKKTEAVLPLTLIPANRTPVPITNFYLQHHQEAQSVSTQRLMPGMEKTKLSFSQHMRKTFGSSKVPKYSFDIVTHVPGIIQINHPSTIPFMVRVSPNWEQTTDSIKGAPQNVTLKTFEVDLETIGSVICPDPSYGSQEASHDNRIKILKYSNKKSAPQLSEQQVMENKLAEKAGNAIPHGATLTIPVGGDDLPSLDLGRVLGLRCQPQDSHEADMLREGFTTYNIKLTHILHWTIRMTIAGEDVVVIGKEDVSVRAPSIEAS